MPRSCNDIEYAKSLATSKIDCQDTSAGTRVRLTPTPRPEKTLRRNDGVYCDNSHACVSFGFSRVMFDVRASMSS